MGRSDGCKRHFVAVDQSISCLTLRPTRRLSRCTATRVVRNLSHELHRSLRTSCISKVTTAELFLRPPLRGQSIRSQKNPSVTDIRAQSFAPFSGRPTAWPPPRFRTGAKTARLRLACRNPNSANLKRYRTTQNQQSIWYVEEGNSKGSRPWLSTSAAPRQRAIAEAKSHC